MSALQSSYRWLDRPITRATMTPGYRFGLVGVALMMVLLPLVYLAICAATAFGVYYHARHSTALALPKIGLVLYLGPIVAGCVGLVFLIKPLFRSRTTVDASLILKRDEESELFRFIDEVCERVGAPKPVKIRVNSEVNASASFDHGWWGILTNRLVLTIGLPLAQGLTVSQFGGVLAHEFGHFSQAAAMRFSYVIRSINNWFGRVVYGRGSWDRRLAQWTKTGPFFLMLIAGMASLFLWLVRRILQGLMRLGHFFSANMMRQMEYDADHYEKEIAGLKNFQATFHRLHLIEAGAQRAKNHLHDLWKGGRLVDNLPLLADEMERSIPAGETQEAGTFAADKSEAKWYDTHPSAHQRLSRTTLSGEEGILLGDQRAQVLFADFEATARAITLVDYRQRFDIDYAPEEIVPTAAYLKQMRVRNARLKRMNDFFGGLLVDHRLLFPVKPGGVVAVYLDELRAEYQSRADELAAQQVFASTLCEKIENARSRRARVLTGDVLSTLGIPVKAADFGLPDLKTPTIDAEVGKCAAEIASSRAALAPILQLAQEKLYLGCLLARSNWAEDSPEKVSRIEELEAFLTATQPISQILNKQRKGHFMASLYLENFQAARKIEQAEQLFQDEDPAISTALTAIEDRSKFIHYPLQDGKKPAHLWGFLVTGLNYEGPVGRFLLLGAIYERFNLLYIEVMLELLDAMSQRGGLPVREEKVIEA